MMVDQRPMPAAEVEPDAPMGPPMEADDHLNRLLVAETQEPWYTSFVRNIRETFNPPKEAPLVVTSKPVPVKDIWGRDENKATAGVGSVVIHVVVLGGILAFGNAVKDTPVAKKAVAIFLPQDTSPPLPEMPKKKQAMAGGGGGGTRDPLPASKGNIPKIAKRQFVPPQVDPPNQAPKLVMEPTIVAQPDAPIPKVDLAQLGDPFSRGTLPSNGPGSGAGIGSGSGGGVGRGSGAGVGPGSGGNFGDGVFRIGGGVSSPVLIDRVDPEYSEEARKAKFQGTVVLALVVDASGRTRDVRVVRSVGMGLDEKAIEAVLKWKFRPGMKDGKAVAVRAQAEVNFRLL